MKKNIYNLTPLKVRIYYKRAKNAGNFYIEIFFTNNLLMRQYQIKPACLMEANQLCAKLRTFYLICDPNDLKMFPRRLVLRRFDPG